MWKFSHGLYNMFWSNPSSKTRFYNLGRELNCTCSLFINKWRSYDAMYRMQESKIKLELFYWLFIVVFVIFFGPILKSYLNRVWNYCYIQLFRERLSCERGKAYTTMSKVIMGNDGFTVAWLNLELFSVVKGNSTNTCIHAFCFLVAESPWNSINRSKTLTTHNAIRRCCVRFYTLVGQPLSKQLYTEVI